jgi:four helix bundle protein
MAPARYDLDERLVAFAVRVCRLTAGFPPSLIGRHAGLQLIRSVTSPAANYAEAQGAESRRDFVHKLRVCLKELREVATWLRFVGRMELSSGASVSEASRECDELIAIFATSVRTAERRMSNVKHPIPKSIGN